MTMPPRLHKVAFTAHVTSSVGWIGAVIVFLALAIVGLSSQDPQTVRLPRDGAGRLVGARPRWPLLP